jgi:Low affinity iron permease
MSQQATCQRPQRRAMSTAGCEHTDGLLRPAACVAVIFGLCSCPRLSSDTWQLVIRTATTLITFQLVFLMGRPSVMAAQCS